MTAVEQTANFRRNLKRLRKRNGCSQEHLAELVTDSGLPMLQQTIYRIEASSRAVRLEEAVAIADVLGESLPDMLGDPEADDFADDAAPINDQILNRFDELISEVRKIPTLIENMREPSMAMRVDFDDEHDFIGAVNEMVKREQAAFDNEDRADQQRLKDLAEAGSDQR